METKGGRAGAGKKNFRPAHASGAPSQARKFSVRRRHSRGGVFLPIGQSRGLVRWIAGTTLVVFLWTSIQPWNYAYAADAPKAAATANNPRAPRALTPAERLESSLHIIKKTVTRAERDAAANKGIAQHAEILAHELSALESADVEIRSRFGEVEAKIKAAKLPAEILQRHSKVVSEYQDDFRALTDDLREIERLGREQPGARVGQGPSVLMGRLNKAKQLVNEKIKDKRHAPLDPNKLPHRPAKPTTRNPRVAQSDFNEYRNSVKVASLGLPLAAVLPAFATGNTPTPEDVAETVEIQFTPGIRALANQLENSPVKIYNFVRNNIRFVPTTGSIQGAEACRVSLECNAFDTASLLIALLRAAGIPSRYVIGTVELRPDLFRSAMGDFKDINAAARFAASGGVPTVLVNDASGKPVAVRMEHVWVDAYVDYVPGRAVTSGTGDSWISLDAALKPMQFQAPLDVGAVLGDGATILLDDLKATGAVSPDGNAISGISEALGFDRSLSMIRQFKKAVATNLPDATVGEVVGALTINARAVTALPASLPGKVLVVGARTPTLTDASRHRLTLQVLDQYGITTDLSLSRATAELAGKRLTLQYEPATQQDADTIDSFGGRLETPPYLVNLRPVVLLEGEEIASGSPIQMGSTQKIRVSFGEPGGASDMVEHQITAGTFAAVGLDLQRVTDAVLQERANRFDAVRLKLGLEEIPGDDVIGEMLHLHAQTYFLQVEGANRIAAHGQNVVALKRPAEMLATAAPSFAYLFGSPVDVINLGMNVDVRRYVVSVASRSGNRDDERMYMFITGSQASASEHTVFEQLQKTRSVSAIKLIAEANNRNIPVFAIHAGNVDVVVPQLQLSSAVINDIRNAVASGKRVVAPKEEIQFLEWQGVGYIVLDPETGAGGYLISGGLAGGGTAETGDFLAVLNTILTALVGIKTLLQISSKLFNAVPIIGDLLALLSAIATGYSVYAKTGEAWKGFAAAFLDLTASYLVGRFVTGLAAGVFLGTTAGLIGLIVATIVVSIIAFVIVQFLTGLLSAWWQSRRRQFADRSADTLSPYLGQLAT